MESRKIKSYHDEPLKGTRKGQRSIRLNKAYRAIYIEKNNGTLEFIEVQEVSKHDY
jgi:proteic killer suppression protein